MQQRKFQLHKEIYFFPDGGQTAKGAQRYCEISNLAALKTFKGQSHKALSNPL